VSLAGWDRHMGERERERAPVAKIARPRAGLRNLAATRRLRVSEKQFSSIVRGKQSPSW